MEEYGRDAARLARALGDVPLEDLSHLLPPLQLPRATPAEMPFGPHLGADFCVELLFDAPICATWLESALAAPDALDGLEGAVLWGRHWDDWLRLDDGGLGGQDRYARLALSWPLMPLPGESVSALAAELGRLLVRAGALAERLGARTHPPLTPAEAAEKALRRRALKTHQARAVELRLRAAGRPFSARSVFRAAESLGLRWGEQDVFHFRAQGCGESLFFLSASPTGGMTPERAQEGEAVAELRLTMETPTNPAPLATLERMALALVRLRELLGGVALLGEAEMDAEALERLRAEVALAVSALEAAGVAPGSPEARALF